jgi:hypothetical protein
MQIQAIIGAGASASDWLHVVAELTGTLLPEMTRLGVASTDETHSSDPAAQTFSATLSLAPRRTVERRL